LDSFGRIGAFQWVMTNPNKKIRRTLNSPPGLCSPKDPARHFFACFSGSWSAHIPPERRNYHKFSIYSKKMQDSCRVSCWSSESGTSLRASWPGLSRLSMWFGASNVRERGKGESFVPAKFCCGPRHVGPVFEALPAWIAGLVPGLVPATTTKDGDQRQTL